MTSPGRCLVVAGLLLSFGLGDQMAAAGTTGFAITATSNRPDGVNPGGTVQYQFRLVELGPATTTPLIATASPPAGTVLVPHSQSCGTSGGSCSESSSGGALWWSIPAGARADSLFIFSFTVAVRTGTTPSEIRTVLDYTGPGCQPGTRCTFDAPPVAVRAAGQQSQVSAEAIARSGSDSTTTPSAGSDSQNVVVHVPVCKESKETKCARTGSGTGSKSQRPTGKTRSGLAYTGDDQLRSVKIALTCLMAGAGFVLVGCLPRRRRPPVLSV